MPNSSLFRRRSRPVPTSSPAPVLPSSSRVGGVGVDGLFGVCCSWLEGSTVGRVGRLCMAQSVSRLWSRLKRGNPSPSRVVPNPPAPLLSVWRPDPCKSAYPMVRPRWTTSKPDG